VNSGDATGINGGMYNNREIPDKCIDRNDKYYSALSVPRFFSFFFEITHAQIGTFTHLVLEKSDFKRDTEIEALEALIDGLVKKGALLPEQAEAVNRRAILNFYSSEAGRLAVKAEYVNRETIFTVRLSLPEYFWYTRPYEKSSGTYDNNAGAPAGFDNYMDTPAFNGIRTGAPDNNTASDHADNGSLTGAPPELPGNDDIFVLMQGSVDCWFETSEGIVLIDYKTGFGANRDISAERYAKFRRQLDLYALALKKITGLDVRRRFICLLTAGDCIEI
jgi:ATP-dependent helicase/nuclease subunit A